MVFGMSKRKDPVCGMKEEKGKGMEKDGMWFCSKDCLSKYGKEKKQAPKKGGCCCGH